MKQIRRNGSELIIDNIVIGSINIARLTKGEADEIFSRLCDSPFEEKRYCDCGSDRDIGNSTDENGIEYCMHCGEDVKRY